MTNKDLREICKEIDVKPSRVKETMVQRIIEKQ